MSELDPQYPLEVIRPSNLWIPLEIMSAYHILWVVDMCKTGHAQARLPAFWRKVSRGQWGVCEGRETPAIVLETPAIGLEGSRYKQK